MWDLANLKHLEIRWSEESEQKNSFLDKEDGSQCQGDEELDFEKFEQHDNWKEHSGLLLLETTSLAWNCKNKTNSNYPP